MPGLILEGIVGAGKTTLYRRLLPHLPAAALALPEHYTERAHEHRPARGLADSLALLETPLAAIESLSALHRDGKFAQDPELAFFALLERFHLSHAVMFAGGDGGPYAAIDARLAGLGFKLAVLTVSEPQIADRLERTRASRPDTWSWYLDHKVAKREPHHSDADVQARLVAHYAAEQRRVLDLAARSRLPWEAFSTDGEDWPALAEQLLAFAHRAARPSELRPSGSGM